MAALTPRYKVRETILDISHKQHKWSEWENCVLVKLLLKVVYVDMYFGGACAFAGNVAIFLNIVYFGGTIVHYGGEKFIHKFCLWKKWQISSMRDTNALINHQCIA